MVANKILISIYFPFSNRRFRNIFFSMNIYKFIQKLYIKHIVWNFRSNSWSKFWISIWRKGHFEVKEVEFKHFERTFGKIQEVMFNMSIKCVIVFFQVSFSDLSVRWKGTFTPKLSDETQESKMTKKSNYVIVKKTSNIFENSILENVLSEKMTIRMRFLRMRFFDVSKVKESTFF